MAETPDSRFVVIQFSNGDLNCIISPKDLTNVLERYIGPYNYTSFRLSATVCAIGISSGCLPPPFRRFFITVDYGKYYVECDYLSQTDHDNFIERCERLVSAGIGDGSREHPFTNLEQCANFIIGCLFE
jgi:hypothetical protein